MDTTFSIGSFLVTGRIGDSSTASVYRGSHPETGVPVAIKSIGPITEPGWRRRFHREVQAQAALEHPGITYLFEYGEVTPEAVEASGGELVEGTPYVAMQFADRGTLREAMPLGQWRPVRRLLIQILDALAHAHAREVIHRDLKPENLLRFASDDGAGDTGWRVKLADFGIAHAFDRERESDADELNVSAGTPGYMSPEQLAGRWREYGPWTDLYAVGCLAWELVCGRPPFVGESRYEVAAKQATEPRPELAPQFPVPDDLEAWIHRAMAIDPTERFRRAADAARSLPSTGPEAGTHARLVEGRADGTALGPAGRSRARVVRATRATVRRPCGGARSALAGAGKGGRGGRDADAFHPGGGRYG